MARTKQVNRPRPSKRHPNAKIKSGKTKAKVGGKKDLTPDAAALLDRTNITRKTAIRLNSRPKVTSSNKPIVQAPYRQSIPRKPGDTRKRTAGITALKEIRWYQQTTGALISFAPFLRIIREISADIKPGGLRYQATALAAIQEAAGSYITEVFNCTNLAAIHAKRVTIQAKDMQVALKIA